MKIKHPITVEKRLNRSYAKAIIPAFLVYAIGVIIPICIGFFYSLTDWNGIRPSFQFIGFENYQNIFKEKRFLESLQFTLKFVLGNTVLQNILALGFALFVDKLGKSKNIIKTVLYIPCLFGAILVGFLWSRIFGSILPDLFAFTGAGKYLQLLTNPDTVLSGLLIINNWQWAGYWMLVYLAGLQSVPEEMYEAAAIEGVNTFQKFIHITLPMLMPAVTICVVAITMGSFQVYELIVSSTGGGPGHASESFIMYIYNLAFASQRSSFASANSMLYVLLLLSVAFIQIHLLRKREIQG